MVTSTSSSLRCLKATPVVPFQEYQATCDQCGEKIAFALGRSAYEKTAGCSHYPRLYQEYAAGVYFGER